MASLGEFGYIYIYIYIYIYVLANSATYPWLTHKLNLKR